MPLNLSPPTASLGSQVRLALEHRPELRNREALLEAARSDTAAAINGPLVPDLSLRANTGGLGGGKNTRSGNFGGTSEFMLGVGWRIGPGGLFDQARTESAHASEAAAHLLLDKTRLRVSREVIEAMARVLGPGWTKRMLIDRFILGSRQIPIVGDAASVADRLIAFAEATGCDGFNLSRTVMPECLDAVVDLLVPVLQDRGAYKRGYAPGTYRDKLFGAGPLLAPPHPAAAARWG